MPIKIFALLTIDDDGGNTTAMVVIIALKKKVLFYFIVLFLFLVFIPNIILFIQITLDVLLEENPRICAMSSTNPELIYLSFLAKRIPSNLLQCYNNI